MKKGRYLRFVFTGLSAPILMLVAYELSRTVSDWFGVPFFALGMLAAAIFLPTGVHSDHPDLYIQLSILLSFFSTWILLLLVVMMTEKLIARLKANVRSNH